MVLIPLNGFEGKPGHYNDPSPLYSTTLLKPTDLTQLIKSQRNHTRRRIRKHTRHSTLTYRDRVSELWPPTPPRRLFTLQYEFLIIE